MKGDRSRCNGHYALADLAERFRCFRSSRTLACFLAARLASRPSSACLRACTIIKPMLRIQSDGKVPHLAFLFRQTLQLLRQGARGSWLSLRCFRGCRLGELSLRLALFFGGSNSLVPLGIGLDLRSRLAALKAKLALRKLGLLWRKSKELINAISVLCGLFMKEFLSWQTGHTP